MKSQRTRRSIRQVVLVLGLVATAAAWAEDGWSGLQTAHADWALLAGASYTDNATLAPVGKSDEIATAGVEGSLYRDSGRLRADLDGVLRYEDYIDHTFPGHLVGNLRSLASYQFVPERLSWVVQDTYGQASLNPSLPTTPSNRINANMLSTGPDANFRFGGDLGLSLGARYARTDFQNNPTAQANDQRVSANVSLAKHFSAASSLSLNVGESRLEYKEPGTPHFDESDAFVRYSTQAMRTGAIVDAGYTQVREAGSTVSDPLLRATVYRRLTPSWNLNLSAGSEFQNSGIALQSALAGTHVVNGQVVPAGPPGAPPGSAGGVGNVIVANSIFRADHVGLSLDFVRPRTTIDLKADETRERYQFGASALDREYTTVGATVTRQLRQSLSLRASAVAARQKTSAQQPGFRSTIADLGLDWRAGSWLTVSLAYHREDRPADPIFAGYVENVIYLGLSYGPPKHSLALPGAPPSGTAGPM